MSRLHFQIGHGYISAVYAGEVEVIRRIFVTVRNRNWQEVPPIEFHAEADPCSRERTVLRARHTSESVDFEWRGFLQIEENADRSTLNFAFEGRALRDMAVCRLGLVVLHPVVPLIGNRVAVDGPEG